MGRNSAGSLLATPTRLQIYNNVFNSRLLCSLEHTSRLIVCTAPLGWNLRMKESKAISQGSSDYTTAAADFKYSMRGKEISITYLGPGSINQEVVRILRRIEYWHQGSVKFFKILYQDADGLGSEVKWDGENAEVIAPR